MSNSLLNYHNKHDPGVPDSEKFLDAGEVSVVSAFLDFCSAKLNEEKTR